MLACVLFKVPSLSRKAPALKAPIASQLRAKSYAVSYLLQVCPGR